MRTGVVDAGMVLRYNFLACGLVVKFNSFWPSVGDCPMVGNQKFETTQIHSTVLKNNILGKQKPMYLGSEYL